MGIRVNLPTAREMIERAIRAKLVPMLKGSPGGGKSAIVHQIAEHYNLKIIDLRLAQCDPTDLLGFPHIDQDRKKSCYVPMSTFPIQGDKIPDGYSGWLLFLDEFTSADRDVQKAAYKLVLDRMVGEYHLHERVAIVCAGNLETDNAIVEEMSTALQSRLIHIEMMVDPKAWLEWARDNGIDYRITSYIQFKPDELVKFNPNHEDNTYPCPRTWEFASRLIKGRERLTDIDRNLLAGTLSEGPARQFIGFTQIFEELPMIQDIVKSPESIRVPTEPSVLFALTGAIGANVDEKNIAGIMAFIHRIPKEFQVIALREITRRHKALVDHPSVQAWIVQNMDDLY